MAVSWLPQALSSVCSFNGLLTSLLSKMKHCATYEGMRGKHSLIPVSYLLGQGKISPNTIVSRAIVFYELAKVGAIVALMCGSKLVKISEKAIELVVNCSSKCEALVSRGLGSILPSTVILRRERLAELISQRLRVKTWPNLVSKMSSKHGPVVVGCEFKLVKPVKLVSDQVRLLVDARLRRQMAVTSATVWSFNKRISVGVTKVCQFDRPALHGRIRTPVTVRCVLLALFRLLP